METQWQYKLKGKPQKSASSKELMELAEKRILMPTDLLWFDGLEEWLPAERLSWLKFPGAAQADDEHRIDDATEQSEPEKPSPPYK